MLAKSHLLKGFGLIAFGIICHDFFRGFIQTSQVGEYLPRVPEIPRLWLDYGYQPPYNESKVALLIENRASNLIAPMIIHFISVLPLGWKFRFMGSKESMEHVKKSAAIRRQAKAGKLDLTYIPKNMTTDGQEEISRFFTNLWLYESVLQPAEWLLVYQTDSMICANHGGTLDDWLEYDWVGAPWGTGDRYGGNGGLSLRRVSSMIRVLQHQQRQNFSEPEDVWLTERLGHLPNSKAANGSMSLRFSGESHWYDEPLGYHTGGSGAWFAGGIWGTQVKRKHIWDYCPEMKITVDMDVEHFMGEVCNQNW